MQLGNTTLAALCLCALLACKSGKEAPATESAKSATATGAASPAVAPVTSTTTAVAKGPS